MVTNQQTVGELAKTYAQMTDHQLLGVYLERDELLPEARFELLAEFQKRSLDADALAKLCCGLGWHLLGGFLK